MPQVCLHTTYTVHPGTETHLLGLIYNLQQSATREPKCQYFNAFTSAEAGSGVVRVVEIWDSQPDYLAYVHANMGAITDFQKSAEGYYTQPHVLEVWNPVDGYKHVRRG